MQILSNYSQETGFEVTFFKLFENHFFVLIFSTVQLSNYDYNNIKSTPKIMLTLNTIFLSY